MAAKARLKAFGDFLWEFFYYSPIEKYKLIRMIVSLPFGIGIGFIMWYAIFARNKHIAEEQKKYLQYIVVGVFAAWYSAFVEARCAVWMMIPTLLGREGTVLAKTMLISYLLTGPVENILTNYREMSNATVCNMLVAKDLAKAHFELNGRPWLNKLKMMMETAGWSRQTGNLQQELTRPLLESITEMEQMPGFDTDVIQRASEAANEEQKRRRRRAAWQEYSDQADDSYLSPKLNKQKNLAVAFQKFRSAYVNKTKALCKAASSKSHLKCLQNKDNLKKVCNESNFWKQAIHILTFRYCRTLVLKNTGLVCDAVKDYMQSSEDCEKEQAEQRRTLAALDEPIKALMDAGAQLNEDLNVSIEYGYSLPKLPQVSVYRLTDLKQDLQYQFGVAFDFVFGPIKGVMDIVVLILLVKNIWSPIRYVSQFNKDLQHDNNYVTHYFRLIDQKRKEENRTTLLPLYAHEKKGMVTGQAPSKVSLLGCIGWIFKGIFTVLSAAALKLVIVAGLIVVTLGLFAFDKVMISIMEVLHEYQDIEIEHEGHSQVVSDVEGTGFMAKMVKAMYSFTINEFQLLNKTKISNIECGVEINRVPEEYKQWIVGLFIFLLLSTFYQGIFGGQRYRIAALYFRKRQKKRILYLYNDMLRKRANFLEFAKKKARMHARERLLIRDVGMLEGLILKDPKRFRFLNWVVKVPCLLCEIERSPAKMMVCPRVACRYYHCEPCWEVVKRRCYACQARRKFTHTDDSEDSDHSTSSEA